MSSRSWILAPYDLRQALLAGVLLPLGVLSAVVVLVIVKWAEQSLEDRLQGEIELISRAVAPAIGARLEAGELGEIRHSLASLFSIRRVYGAAVYDADGDRVVSVGISDGDLSGSRAATDVVRTGRDDGRYRSVEGRDVYSYFSPLIDHGGRINGLLQITRERQEIDAGIARLRLSAWWFWLASVAVAVTAMLVLHRRLVGRPVRLLLSRMRALAGGDRTVSFHAGSPREFAQIGAGFNEMVRSIRVAEVEIERRQQHEQQLQRQLQEAERVAVLGRVTQGLAHELASPLTVIDARIRRLERGNADQRFRPLLRDVRRQAARMSDIVRQLLNYGPAAQSMRQPVVLFDLLRRMAREVDAGSVRLVVRDDPGGSRVCGDPVRLELAMSNLVRNALRHAHERVEVGVVRAGDQIHVYVRDDGNGVPERDRAHIFQPFFTRQPAGTGTGLGLAIVASVMREHGGEVWHEDDPAGGTRFTLVFPQPAAEESA